MRTLVDYKQALEEIRRPTKSEELNELCEQFAQILEQFQASQEQLVDELLTMYGSAAEHNVDVSRDAVYDLAKRLISDTQDRSGG